MSAKNTLIKLAYENPELREGLLPLIQKLARPGGGSSYRSIKNTFKVGDKVTVHPDYEKSQGTEYGAGEIRKEVPGKGEWVVKFPHGEVSIPAEHLEKV